MVQLVKPQSPAIDPASAIYLPRGRTDYHGQPVQQQESAKRIAAALFGEDEVYDLQLASHAAPQAGRDQTVSGGAVPTTPQRAAALQVTRPSPPVQLLGIPANTSPAPTSTKTLCHLTLAPPTPGVSCLPTPAQAHPPYHSQRRSTSGKTTTTLFPRKWAPASASTTPARHALPVKEHSALHPAPHTPSPPVLTLAAHRQLLNSLRLAAALSRIHSRCGRTHKHLMGHSFTLAPLLDRHFCARRAPLPLSTPTPSASSTGTA